LRALSGGRDGRLRLWDLGGQALAELRGHGHGVSCVAMDWASRRALSAGGDRSLWLWDLERCDALRRLAVGGQGGVACLSVSWAAQRALAGCDDGALRLWGLQEGPEEGGPDGARPLWELQGHDGPVLCLAAEWDS